MDSGLLLFDGVPGSGKTTTSRQVSETIKASAGRCGWALEEGKDHPFFGPGVRRRHREDDYDDRCLERWRLAVEQAAGQVWVLEGCALQSTVRYMFEQDWERERIDRYWERCIEVLAAVPVRLVYFRHRDVETFIRSHTLKVRADVWEKISTHVVGTRVGARLIEQSVEDVPVDFWVRYSHLCDDLVDRFSHPVLNLDVADGWDLAAAQVEAWLDEMPGEPSTPRR